MPKKKTQPLPDVLWFVATAYIADALGLLYPPRAAVLDGQDPNWRNAARGALEIDDEFVKVVFAQARRFREPVPSLAFVLNGLGCPDAGRFLREVLA